MTIDKEIFPPQEKQKNIKKAEPEENIGEEYEEIVLPNSHQEIDIERIRLELQSEINKNEQISARNLPINNLGSKKLKEFSLKNLLPRFIKRKLNRDRIVNDPATAHDPYYDED